MGYLNLFSVLCLGVHAISCSSEDALQTDSAAAGGGIAAGAGGTGGQVGSTTVGSFVGSGGFYPTQELCPPNPPMDGDSCPNWYQSCEYGDDPRIDCRTLFRCLAAGPDPTVWVEWPPGYCPSLDPNLCPLEPDTSGLCSDPEALCIYPDGAQCGCVSMQWYEWHCVPPPETGCPVVAPNFGQPCQLEGAHCEYGSCRLGTWAIRACLSGTWTSLVVQCP
jgi:hypothetical protein